MPQHKPITVPKYFDRFLVQEIWIAFRDERIRLGLGREKFADYIYDCILSMNEKFEVQFESGDKIESVLEAFPGALTFENFFKNGFRQENSKVAIVEQVRTSPRTLQCLYLFLLFSFPDRLEKHGAVSKNLDFFLDGANAFTEETPIDEAIPKAIRLYKCFYIGEKNYSYFYNRLSSDEKIKFIGETEACSSNINRYRNALNIDFDGVLLSRPINAPSKREYLIFSAYEWENLAYEQFGHVDVEDTKFAPNDGLRQIYWREPRDFAAHKRKQIFGKAIFMPSLAYPKNYYSENFSVNKETIVLLRWMGLIGGQLDFVAKGFDATTMMDLSWVNYVDLVFRKERAIDLYTRVLDGERSNSMRSDIIAMPLTDTDKKLANFLLKSEEY